MFEKLRALLAAFGIITIGGTDYRLATPLPTTTRAELVDAGMLEVCAPVTVVCAGRNLCQGTRADGGLTQRYQTFRALGYQCDGLDREMLILRIQNPECFEPIGPAAEACRVIASTTDDGGTARQPEPDRCACRPSDGGVCRYQLPDGGTPLMNPNQTYPAPFGGAGCVRKVCTEAAGEQGQSMPEACLP